MLWKLLILFTLVPLIELMILVKLSALTGSVMLTLGIVILTGIAGAALAKYQGLKVLKEIQSDLGVGIIPGDRILDGLIILVAAAFLVTPGVLTDVFGLLMLVPGPRAGMRALVKAWLRNWMASGRVRFVGSTRPADNNRDDDSEDSLR